MTHFTALVILDPNIVNIQGKLEEILLPYYSELEVEPHKEYLNKELLQAEIDNLLTLSKEDIEKLAIEYEISGENIIEQLAKINLECYEEDVAGVDERGEYQIVTYNSQGKWDSYRLIEFEPRESEPPVYYPCKVGD